MNAMRIAAMDTFAERQGLKRGQGIAEVLVAHLLARFSANGFERVYLSAKPHLHGFYQTRGWTLIEDEVGVDRLGIFVRALP